MNAFEGVREILAGQLGLKPELIQIESKLTDDLKVDSLDAVDIMLAVEEKFNIELSDEEGNKTKTVSEIVALVQQKLQEKSNSTS